MREREFQRATCSVSVLPGDKLPATTLGLQTVDDATCRLRSDPHEESEDSARLMKASQASTKGGITRALFSCDDGLAEEKQDSVIRQKLEAVLAWDRQIISDLQ